VSAAAAAATATPTADAAHVFNAVTVDRHTAGICAVLDPVFLAEAGWDAAWLVLCPPPDHPLLGRPVCLGMSSRLGPTVTA
jgi:hypothetical protein